MHHGPLPQALRILGGNVFRENLIKQKACTVIKASALLFVQFCIKANNYSQSIHSVFIQCESTSASDHKSIVMD